MCWGRGCLGREKIIICPSHKLMDRSDFHNFSPVKCIKNIPVLLKQAFNSDDLNDCYFVF